ncbi:MAG TPA: copper transporter [Acidimicrobiia bacterium]|nr:copper transporter [Acidimicrobiia bacterium]
MINFRFHLVSLIAVFLAMGLGILVGSTVVDQVIVDRLDREISSVSHESNQLKSENSKLQDQVAKLNDFVRRSSAYSAQSRLTAVPIVILAEKGIAGSAVSAVLASVRAAGADVPGVLWLNDKWRLDSPKDLAALQTATRVTGNVAASRLAALRVLAGRLAAPDTTRTRRRRDVVEPLRSAGFLDFTDGKRADLAAFPSRAARLLVLTGTDSHLSGTDTMVDLVQSALAVQAPTVVGEVYDDKGGISTASKRGSALEPVRGAPPLAKLVTTFDDAELPQGPLTAVIALDQIAGGTIGHYGYGQGASEPIPPLPS